MEDVVREVRAIEAVVDEIKDRFGGEDPLVPVARALLDNVGASLVELHEELKKYGVSELPEVDEEALSRVRRMAHLSGAV